MFWLAAAALAASTPWSPQPTAASATVQATATVRVISGTVIQFDSHVAPDAAVRRASVIRADGTRQSARLVEFQ